MAALRGALLTLEEMGKVRILQRGQPVKLRDARGPFRVAPSGSHPAFRLFIGMDYSGAGEPARPQPGLKVAIAAPGEWPRIVPGPHRNGQWCRKSLFEWLVETERNGRPALIGIDHALGLPASWMKSRGVRTWPALMRWVVETLRTDLRPVRHAREELDFPTPAEGWRLCDRRTPGAKSLFHFDVPGTVASSTLAGLPWIAHWRQLARKHILFWPFEGWMPAPGQSMVAEVFPTLWRGLQSPAGLCEHARDAWVVSRWLETTCTTGRLREFLHPRLTPAERAAARREGWILGMR